MADMVLPGPVENNEFCRGQTVNIHTMKISDACKDKDCIEDLRVYPTASSQAVLESAFSIRPAMPSSYTQTLMWRKSISTGGITPLM